jgi:hypothetical protein
MKTIQMPMEEITVRVPKVVADRYRRWCEEQGYTLEAAVRSSVLGFVEAELDANDPLLALPIWEDATLRPGGDNGN